MMKRLMFSILVLVATLAQAQSDIGLKGQKLLAQGVALGRNHAQPTPCKGKSITREQMLQIYEEVRPRVENAP